MGSDLRVVASGNPEAGFGQAASTQAVKRKIGVAFDLSRMDTIHPLPHDIGMNVIVTESGIYPASS